MSTSESYLYIYSLICAWWPDLPASTNINIFSWATLYVRKLYRSNDSQMKGTLTVSSWGKYFTYLFGMSLASLEKFISRPCTSIPTLKASSRSRPENFGLGGRASDKARRTGRTAPEGWVAGCHVSSKSMEWIYVERHANNNEKPKCISLNTMAFGLVSI